MQSKEKENGGRLLWQITAVRDLLWIMAAAVLLWLLYHLRHILLPIFAGLVLAYLLDPVITKVKCRWGISRLFSVLLICSLVLLAGAGIGLWATPLRIKQSATGACCSASPHPSASSLELAVPVGDAILPKNTTLGVRVSTVSFSTGGTLP